MYSHPCSHVRIPAIAAISGSRAIVHESPNAAKVPGVDPKWMIPASDHTSANDLSTLAKPFQAVSNPLPKRSSHTNRHLLTHLTRKLPCFFSPVFDLCHGG